jgi:protein-disulfide isomerase
MTSFTRTVPLLVLALTLAAPLPAAASTSSELKALQEEVHALREGQRKMQKDLADIKKLLEQGARAAPGQQAFKPADFVVGESPTRGAADAPVTLVEFSDYQCPFCKRHATDVMPEIVKQYVDSGKVRIVMREMPIESIHPLALAASNAALCAREQGQYWAMHDLLFANQKSLQPADLKAHAVTLGLDTAAFDACLDENRFADEIKAGQAEGQKLGISGTPSFVAGLTDPQDSNKVRLTKFVRGAQPLANFQQVLDGLLKEAAEKD